MSIHVTINGNPVCQRRDRAILSDFERIKNFERARRRRLRLEQVRQQHKDISHNILQQCKNIARKEFNIIQNDEKSDLRRLHDEKILEIQRKYQEDMDDIGLAHSSAVIQPNVEAILKSQHEKNQTIADLRGKKAQQRLNDCLKADNPAALQQDRLRQVREIEDIRASLVANLPTKSPQKKPKNDINSLSVSTTEASSSVPTGHTSPKRNESSKKGSSKKMNGKKSPVKVLSKPNVKVTPMHTHKTTTPARIVIEVGNGNDHAMKSNKKHSQATTQVPPLTNRSDKSSKYNPNDYIHVQSASSTSSTSSLISDDSSYFSDGSVLAAAATAATTTTVIPSKSYYVPCNSTSKTHCTTDRSKVKVYDHGTRHRGAYETPQGLVERIDIQNEPSAHDMARKIVDSTTVTDSAINNQRLTAEKRGNDAELRNKVRRDYESLVKNLDNLSREERKLNATRLTNPRADISNVEKARKKQMNDTRQRLMDRAYDAAVNGVTTSNLPSPTQQSQPTEAIITLEPRFQHTTCVRPAELSAENTKSCCVREKINEDDQLSREEQILDLLKRNERQKRLLLQEFGATLPNDILNAIMTPLFANDNSQTQTPVHKETKKQTPASPEIKVINLSKTDKSTGKKSTTKKKENKTKITSKKIESAVQTSDIQYDKDSGKNEMENVKNAENGVVEDKSVQVEIPSDIIKHSSIRTSSLQSDRLEYVEPVVTIITHGNQDSNSDLSDRGLIINVGRGKVEVTPRKQHSKLKSKHSKTQTLSSDSIILPIKQQSTSIMTSIVTSEVGATDKSQDTSDDASDTTTASATSSTIESAPAPQPPPPAAAAHKQVQTMTKQTHITRISSIEPTTDRSYDQSTTEGQTDTFSNNLPYKLPGRRVEHHKETSDTSTSYASLPSGNIHVTFTKGTNISDILELVDSTLNNESMQRKRREASPVSTPETPSSSIMRVPGNMADPRRIADILAVVARRIENDSTLASTIQHEESTFFERRQIIHQRSQDSSQQTVCTCGNPICRSPFEHDDSGAMGSGENLETTQYDDAAQNAATQKIAELDDRLNRVREERSAEFSSFAVSDDTSLMLLPPTRPEIAPQRTVDELVANINNIHDQLQRTLQESCKVISGNILQKMATSHIGHSTPKEEHEQMSTKISPPREINDATAKAKPIIIGDEIVQVDLKRYKRYPAVVPKQKTATDHHENMVEKLSQEILEQSQKSDKQPMTMMMSKIVKTEESLKNFIDTPSSKQQEQQISETDYQRSTSKKEQSFIPILAGIPTKPLNGSRPAFNTQTPYRLEKGNLSTIEEAATPETTNQSYGSVKPLSTGKSRKNLNPTFPNFPATNNNNKSNGSSSIPVPSNNVKSPRRTRSPGIDRQLSPTLKERSRKNGENYMMNECVKSPDSFLIHYSTRNVERDILQHCQLSNNQNNNNNNNNNTMKTNCVSKVRSEKKLTSSSSNSLSGFSGISEILSTPSSDSTAIVSPPEKMEDYLMGLGLAWLIPIARKTREASALSSSSSSDVTLTVTKRTKSPMKKLIESGGGGGGIGGINKSSSPWALPDLSDVSSISIREASKSTEKTVLMKARTSTPNMPNVYYTSEKSSLTTTSTSAMSLHDHSDSIIVKNLSLHLKT